MAYNQQQQPCDTYFVEEAYAPARSHQRDYVKEMGRRRQQAMADELSRQACDTYMEDIVAHMRNMEVTTPGPLRVASSSFANSPHRTRPSQMLPQLISNKKSSGSCGLTWSTS
jgi:hypothetical protein